MTFTTGYTLGMAAGAPMMCETLPSVGLEVNIIFDWAVMTMLA